jgi:DNA end-binding protein Ku
MTIEKFVDSASIDPVYYDAAYFLAPDGNAGRDVYAVLREAIGKSGKTALARVVIAQRERTIALRPVEGGLMAHTLYENRDLNNSNEIFDGATDIRTDPEMVKLATQLVERHSAKYDASDIEDRYETRMREMIDAKLKGEGIDLEVEAPAAVSTSNVIDLMAALKKSLGDSPAAQPAEPKRQKAADTRQTGMKLLIKGGKVAADKVEKTPTSTAKPARKRA